MLFCVNKIVFKSTYDMKDNFFNHCLESMDSIIRLWVFVCKHNHRKCKRRVSKFLGGDLWPKIYINTGTSRKNVR